MARPKLLLVAIAFLVGCSCNVYQEPTIEYTPATPAPLYIEIARDHTYKVDLTCPEGGATGTAVGIGDSYAITAKHITAHFVPGCTLEVIDRSGTKYPALILEQFPTDDIALILVAGSSLPMVPFHSPDLGMPVMAVGYPGGTFAVTVGHVGGYPDEDGEVRFTAPIYYGSSGGGIWDMRAHLVGISVNMVTNRPLWSNMVPAGRIYSSTYLASH